MNLAEEKISSAGDFLVFHFRHESVVHETFQCTTAKVAEGSKKNGETAHLV